MLWVLRCWTFYQTHHDVLHSALFPCLGTKCLAIHVHRITSQKYESPEVRPPLDNLAEALEHPPAISFPLMFWQNVNICQVGKGHIIRDDSQEADLFWIAKAYNQSTHGLARQFRPCIPGKENREQPQSFHRPTCNFRCRLRKGVKAETERIVQGLLHLISR